MTPYADPDFDPRIADWLQADPIAAPGLVLELVLASFPTMPQRRARRLRRRLWTRNRFAFLAIGLAAIGIIAVVGAALLTSRQPSVGPPAPVVSPPGPSATPSAPVHGPTSPSAGSAQWTAAGSMAEVRFGETATLLPTGDVLVVGGRSDWGGHGFSWATAELFDPGTGTWTPTGTLHQGRQGQAAVLLASGDVLVAGGDGSGGGPGAPSLLTTAELYNPGTGLWRETGPLTAGRSGATATLLPDGRVILIGGLSASGPARSAELYDPATGTWARTTGMSVGRQGHTATLLADGRVLVVGGGCCNQSARASAELFDPSTGTWTKTGSLASPRLYHTAVLLAGGSVLVYGGDNRSDHPSVTTAELYDPGTGRWSATGNPSNAGNLFEAQGAVAFQAVPLPDGTVFAPAYAAAAELYDPASDSWRTVGGLPGDAYVYVHTATALADGRVLLTYEPASAIFNPKGAP